MRIAVIGPGKVGVGIGGALLRAGHDVTFGSRDPERITAELPAGSQRATIADACTAADAILVTVKGNQVENLLASHGEHFAGRLVLDSTNFRDADRFHRVPEWLAAAPGVRLFRVFCTLGYEHFVTPQIDGEQIDLFYCGGVGDAVTLDDDSRTVEAIVASIGLRPVRLGGLDQAGVLDGVTKLWFTLALGGRGRNVAFRTLGLD
jgi:predicted dinucleotide-binding enzyme